MTVYVREKLKDFVLAPWPPVDPTEHAFIIGCLQYALQANLLTIFDINAGLSYACGYEDRARELEIRKFYTVTAELTGYTNYAFVNRYYREDSEQTKQVKAVTMDKIGLWNT